MKSRPLKADVFIFLMAVAVVMMGAMFAHARVSQAGAGDTLKARADLVRRLGLTDLCLFTEARYTRHPALADVHTPFQDHPFSLEHFPSGSLMMPPGHLSHPGGGQ